MNCSQRMGGDSSNKEKGQGNPRKRTACSGNSRSFWVTPSMSCGVGTSWKKKPEAIYEKSEFRLYMHYLVQTIQQLYEVFVIYILLKANYNPNICMVHLKVTEDSQSQNFNRSA